jgi:hypothetical protein
MVTAVEMEPTAVGTAAGPTTAGPLGRESVGLRGDLLPRQRIRIIESVGHREAEEAPRATEVLVLTWTHTYPRTDEMTVRDGGTIVRGMTGPVRTDLGTTDLGTTGPGKIGPVMIGADATAGTTGDTNGTAEQGAVVDLRYTTGPGTAIVQASVRPIVDRTTGNTNGTVEQGAGLDLRYATELVTAIAQARLRPIVDRTTGDASRVTEAYIPMI